jgi:hypothetical protein
MKDILLKPLKPFIVQVAGTLLFFAGIGLGVLKYIKILWKNQREQKKQKEEHEKETLKLKEEHEKETLKLKEKHEKALKALKALKQKQDEFEKQQQYILKSDFHPRNIAQVMDLIESKFEKNKWYPQEDLWREIYNKTHTKYNHDLIKQVIHGLAERDFVKIKEDAYGQLQFMRKN